MLLLPLLNGCGLSAPNHSDTLGAGSAAALDHIRDTFAHIGSPDASDLLPEGALHELLGSSSVYSCERADILPYAKDKVSWPIPGSVPCPLEAGLGSADCERLADWQSEMLRDPIDAAALARDSGITKPYLDPILMANTHAYSDFIKRLDDAGMISWERPSGRKGALGILFVKKKDGTLRLMLDTHILNHKFKNPPHTPLPTSAAFQTLRSIPNVTCTLAPRISATLSTLSRFPLRLRANFLYLTLVTDILGSQV